MNENEIKPTDIEEIKEGLTIERPKKTNFVYTEKRKKLF